MEDELNLDNIEVQAEEKLKVKNRFQQLSDKVATTSKERDDALAKAQAEAEDKTRLEKERDFYKDFSTNVSKYPNASEYQDKILEKVKSGYSTEDAMVSVLAKEGKLTSPRVETAAITAEGGSASTVLAGDKTTDQMSADDKRAALIEAEKTGDLERAIRGR
jgi:hypothetical protein